MSVFVHIQGIKTVHAGEGVKKWQKSVHVVVECPNRKCIFIGKLDAKTLISSLF